MGPLPDRHTQTFILRIWREYLAEVPPSWRGEIEDVTSKEVTRFGSRKALIEAIDQCICGNDEVDPPT